MIDNREVVVYRTSQAHLLAGEKNGCQLCCLLVDLGASDGAEAEIDFQVDIDPDNPVDEPTDTQYLLVHARVGGQSDRYMTYCMYTPAGASFVCCSIQSKNMPPLMEIALNQTIRQLWRLYAKPLCSEWILRGLVCLL
jgi:hypothetical protein